ncbi:hypothetical protein [Amycolatopsis thermoflava]|uniref:hypothetical protein n=1 Tax=Amycolatopsis thermoflava TaxID=84480 RepID=UPI00040842DA|nr:hypothetical protein [Amycolatopsis thermoflava]
MADDSPLTGEVQFLNSHDQWTDGQIVDTWTEEYEEGVHERWYAVIDLTNPDGIEHEKHADSVRKGA